MGLLLARPRPSSPHSCAQRGLAAVAVVHHPNSMICVVQGPPPGAAPLCSCPSRARPRLVSSPRRPHPRARPCVPRRRIGARHFSSAPGQPPPRSGSKEGELPAPLRPFPATAAFDLASPRSSALSQCSSARGPAPEQPCA
ncbi:hypothetical protein ZWY2020_047888 [Hordeum vulgare]|nr:hypothetical protein ZWY2020_047888 [Hordeum vulgare]